MFSIFCAPKNEPEEDGIQYLNHGEKHSTFDTLETEGTDDSSIDKNLERASAESLLDTATFVDTDDDTFVDKASEMSQDVLVTRESGELREAVPLIQNEEHVANGPGLAPDLGEPVTVEGPDFATNENDKRKPGSLNVSVNMEIETGSRNGDERVNSLAIVLYQPRENVGTVSDSDEQVKRTISDDEDGDPVQDCNENGQLLSDVTPGEDVSEAADLCVDTSKTETGNEDDDSTNISPKEVNATESETGNQESIDTKDVVERVAGESDEERILAEPAGSDASSIAVGTVASELLMPMPNHSDSDLSQKDSRNSRLPNKESRGGVSPTGSLESGDTGSDYLTDVSEKSVRFAEPLVTSSWDVPRVHSDDLEALFYTAMDISKFRKQQKGGAPARPYDKAHCERLVEDLDRLGAESFVAGDFQKALGAFNHSLQVKTQIMTDCDNCSTATTIHCIADVYSKKGKWIQAMDAYNAALEVLERADDTEEVRLSKVALSQKVHIIRRLLGLNKRWTPS